MKKNKMMRVASALLVAVLLTTCAISGTFAKYVSQATGEDTARVAKWGWGDTSISIDLFATDYDGTVASANGTDKVIAPGTSKTANLVWTPASSFAPEVDYVLSFTAVGDIPTLIENELTWTLDIDNAGATTYDTFDALVTALEAKTYSCEANAVAATVDIEIGWNWTFDGGDDAADTYLGNMDTLEDLTITVTMTATQVN